MSKRKQISFLSLMALTWGILFAPLGQVAQCAPAGATKEPAKPKVDPLRSLPYAWRHALEYMTGLSELQKKNVVKCLVRVDGLHTKKLSKAKEESSKEGEGAQAKPKEKPAKFFPNPPAECRVTGESSGWFIWPFKGVNRGGLLKKVC